MATRVFISFDYDHDEDLRTLLANQAKFPDSPFEIADWSVRQPFTGNWQEKVKQRIGQVGQVAVICGHYIDTATGVVTVAFVNGKSYRFGNFTPELMAEWGAAESAGKWFSTNVRKSDRHPQVEAA